MQKGAISDSFDGCLNKTQCKNDAKSAYLQQGGSEKDFQMDFKSSLEDKISQTRETCLEIAETVEDKNNCEEVSKNVLKSLGGNEADYNKMKEKGIEKSTYGDYEACVNEFKYDDNISIENKTEYEKNCKSVAKQHAMNQGVNVNNLNVKL